MISTVTYYIAYPLSLGGFFRRGELGKGCLVLPCVPRVETWSPISTGPFFSQERLHGLAQEEKPYVGRQRLDSTPLS